MTDKSDTSSLSERCVDNYHQRNKHRTGYMILACVGLAILSSAATYLLVSYFSKQTIAELVIVPVILSILSLLATLKSSLRFVLVLSVFIGISAGAVIRIIW
jgi:hypothetical protein